MARILYIDGNNKELGLYSTALTASGYTVASAENSHEALEKAEKKNLDLVVIDIEMPDARRIISDIRGLYGNVPIIIYSGKPTLYREIKGYRVEDRIMKDPNGDIIELGECVREQLRKRNPVWKRRSEFAGDLTAGFGSYSMGIAYAGKYDIPLLYFGGQTELPPSVLQESLFRAAQAQRENGGLVGIEVILAKAVDKHLVVENGDSRLPLEFIVGMKRVPGYFSKLDATVLNTMLRSIPGTEDFRMAKIFLNMQIIPEEDREWEEYEF